MDSIRSAVDYTAIVVTAALLTFTSDRAGAADPPAGGVELYPGVVVDVGADRAYVMDPEGRLNAINADTGEVLWSADAAAKPLAVAAGRVLAQAETPAAENGLRLVSLDVNSGIPADTSVVELPAGVEPLIASTPNREFVADLTVEGDRVDVTWQYSERALRGLPPGVDEPLPPAGDGAAPAGADQREGARVHRGKFRVSLATGEVSRLEPTDAAADLAPAATVAEPVPAAELIAALPRPQFLSADGRHVLIGRRTGDILQKDRYSLAVYDRGTAQRLVEFPSMQPAVRFVVLGPRVLYQTEPYVSAAADGFQEVPPALHAVRVPDGRRLWTHPIRDVSAETPTPP